MRFLVWKSKKKICLSNQSIKLYQIDNISSCNNFLLISAYYTGITSFTILFCYILDPVRVRIVFDMKRKIYH